MRHVSGVYTRIDTRIDRAFHRDMYILYLDNIFDQNCCRFEAASQYSRNSNKNTILWYRKIHKTTLYFIFKMGLKASGSQFLSVCINICGKYSGFPVLRLSRIYFSTKRYKKSVIVTEYYWNFNPAAFL